MKKILLFASALAGLFLAGSCQRENLEPMESANTVTYTVQVPGALSTKAIGENVAAVTELVYEVYRTEATSADDFTQAETLLFHKTATITNGTATVEFELVNDQNFRVLFWAQVPGNGVYTVTDLKNVTISRTLNANAENYAAFAGADYIKAGESIVGRELPLVRPIAQLNIGTDDASLWIENQTKALISTSAVKVNGLSTSYNVAEDKAGEISDAYYVYAAKPVAPTTEYPGLSESTFEVNDINYNYVAMNYVGFAPQMGTNVEVTYTINTENVGTIENTIDNVPVKANHRTNIVGNLITSMSDYTITLDREWDDDEYNVEVVSVATAADLQEAITNIQNGAEGNIKLEGDIDLSALAGLISTKADEPVAPTYGLLIPAGKSLVLDLNGNTLAQTVNCTASYSMIENHGSLTIIDSKGEGTISFKDTGAGDSSFGWGSYTISNNGNLVVNGGTIEHTGEQNTPGNVVHMYCAIQQNNANAVTTINGGTISTPTYRSIRICRGTANIKGGDMIGQVWAQPFDETIVLNIEGGNFQPTGGDGSSVFVTNDKAVDFAVTGGFFATKVSCSVPANLAGTVTGGIFTASASENTPAALYEGYRFVQDGENFILEPLPAVAKIGETGYWSLNAAVAAVQDGETITLVKNETFTEANRTHNSGTWYDGLYYIGDKSFTIDLGGKTISQNGAVNDYLLNFKNDGAKANVITLKNGTIDAGTAAFCALCTSSTSTQELTINLEGVNLINNMSNGSTLKIRGATTTLNVKSGTKITGKDSYLGIESWQSTINIYDGAEIYMNGTSSYNGCLVGVGGNGVANVYGGYGKGVKGVFIAMTSGGTINVAGGEWIANTDGTVGDNSNVYVLTAQNNKYESGYAGPSIINVKGGTFRGGMDAWILNDVNVEKAELNISGGNFNADPSAYLEDACEATENAGVWTVRVLPAAKIGETEYASLQEAFNVGGNVTLLRDVTITETATLAEGKSVVLDLNDKTISGTMHKNDGCVIKNNGTMTIKNGTISSTAANGGSAVQNYGTLQIENTLINGADREGESWPAYPINNYANMTLNKVTVYGNQGVIACNAAGETILTECNLVKNYMKTSSHVFYINHAEAKVIVHSGTYAHNGFDGSLAYVNKGMITVNGGTFTTKDGGYGMAALSAGTIIVNGGTLPAFLNWGGKITDNR